jgi:hypothetical protein
LVGSSVPTAAILIRRDARQGSGQSEGAGTEPLELSHHLANRLFAVVVHSDADGTENLRRSLTDWLTDWS